MPVEFLCPHCRARMRTNDDTMGREIGCPKCKGRLTIPTVEIPEPEPVVTLVDEPGTAPEEALAAAPQQGAASEFPAFGGDAPVFNPAVATTTGLPTSSPEGGGAASTYRRRKKSNTGWIVMFGVGVVTAAVLGGIFYVQNAGPGKMVGTLTARAIDGDSVSTSLALPESVAAERLTVELAKDPVVFRTPTFDTEFGSSAGDMTITITKNEAGQLVEVDGTADVAIRAFLEAYGTQVLQRRQQKLAGELAAFVEAVGTDPVNREAAAGYRDSVGLPAMQSTLGPHVVANVDGTAYPVVSEPEPGVLRFAVPIGTSTFTLLRAPANPGLIPETLDYTVTVGP